MACLGELVNALLDDHTGASFLPTPKSNFVQLRTVEKFRAIRGEPLVKQHLKRVEGCPARRFKRAIEAGRQRVREGRSCLDYQ